tara:strand:+ start:3091 stop:3549 length:459 start_codon:yes stop_codon:yes gene_type:complete
MGYYTTVYVGVYIEVPRGKNIVKKYTYIDNETNLETPHKFSPENGQPNELVVKEKTEDIYPYPGDLADGKYEDKFLSFEFSGAKAGYETWLPNTNAYGDHIDANELTNISLFGFDPKDKINKFINENKEFIDETESKYPGIVVKYGMAMVSN